MARTKQPVEKNPTTKIDFKTRVRDRDEDGVSADEAANKMPRTEQNDAGFVEHAKTAWEAWRQAEKERRMEEHIEQEVERMTAEILSKGVTTLKWEGHFDTAGRGSGVVLFWKESQLTQAFLHEEEEEASEATHPLDEWSVDWDSAYVGEVAESELRDCVRNGVKQAIAEGSCLCGGL